MKMGGGYGRGTDIAAVALLGLVIVTDAAHVGPMAPSVAYADTIRTVTNVCEWTALGWDQLSDSEKQAFQKLGWSSDNWQSNAQPVPASSSKKWSELTPEERDAAQELGFNEQNWEAPCQ